MKSRVMFLGYYMFLLSGTRKEEILPTHLTIEYRPKILKYLTPVKYYSFQID